MSLTPSTLDVSAFFNEGFWQVASFVQILPYFVLACNTALQTATPVHMVQELSYSTLSHILESWERLRRIKKYDEYAGRKLFQR
jgi:hypothetical protein